MSQYYLERENREHVTPYEWLEAVSRNKRTKLAFDPESLDLDASVYFEDQDHWYRSFHWHWGPNKEWGVVTFTGFSDELRSKVIDEVASELAESLRAKVVFEDHTWYEN